MFNFTSLFFYFSKFNLFHQLICHFSMERIVALVTCGLSNSSLLFPIDAISFLSSSTSSDDGTSLSAKFH